MEKQTNIKTSDRHHLRSFKKSSTRLTYNWRDWFSWTKTQVSHLFEFGVNEVKSFHMIFESFLHLFVNGHNLIQGVTLLFFVLMNYFELYLIQSLSVVDDVFVGFVEIIKFWSGVFDKDLFIRMDKFGLSSVSCPHLKVRAVFLNAENFVTLVKSHLFWVLL